MRGYASSVRNSVTKTPGPDWCQTPSPGRAWANTSGTRCGTTVWGLRCLTTGASATGSFVSCGPPFFGFFHQP